MPAAAVVHAKVPRPRQQLPWLPPPPPIEGCAGTQYSSQPAYNPYAQQAPPAYPPAYPPPPPGGNYAYGNAAYQAQPPSYNPNGTVTGYPQGAPPPAGTQAPAAPPQAVHAV